MAYFSALVVRIHVLMGMVLGVFFAAFGLTGAALAFRPALEERLYWPACTSCALESGQWEAAAARLTSEGKRVTEVPANRARHDPPQRRQG